MSRQPAPEPEAEHPDGAGPTDPIDSDDTEGLSFGAIPGVNATWHGRAVERPHRREDDSDFRPTRKTFSGMRPEKRG